MRRKVGVTEVLAIRCRKQTEEWRGVDEVDRQRVGFTVEEFAAPSKRHKGKTRPVTALKRALTELDAMQRDERWGEVRPRHLVALYAKLHQVVYGVDAPELESNAYWAAVRSAERMIERHFAGDVAASLEFLRWTWRREREREKRRRADGDGGSGARLGWALQFCVAGGLIADYRVAAARNVRRAEA